MESRELYNGLSRQRKGTLLQENGWLAWVLAACPQTTIPYDK